MGLAPRGQPVLDGQQVVQRPAHEHEVVRGVGGVQLARIAESRGHAGDFGRAGHMQRHGVDKIDPMAPLGQPARVHPGPAADIHNGRWRGRQVALHKFPGAHELQQPAAGTEPPVFHVLLVIGLHLSTVASRASRFLSPRNGS